MENKIKNALAKSYLSLLKAKAIKEEKTFTGIDLTNYSSEELLKLIETTAKSFQREKSLKELENDIKIFHWIIFYNKKGNL